MKELKIIRNDIDRLDKIILDALAQRIVAAKKAGEIKRSAGLKIYDPEREAQILLELEDVASEYNLDKVFIQNIFKIIIKKCREEQL